MSEATPGTDKLILCPYCGHAQFGGERCQACAGLFEPLSRRATQLAMGPWQIRDKNNPFRPGCCYDILKSMAKAGKIKNTTVMRGPTTRQFWSVARNVPGVAHLIGYCHACGNHVSPTDAKCGECNAIFQEPRDRNGLGLAYKTDEEAELGQTMLDAEIRGEPIPARQMPGPTKKPKPAKAGDLLSEVLDLSGDIGPSPAIQPGTLAPASPAPSAIPSTHPKRPAPAAIDFAAKPAGLQAPAPTSAFDVAPTHDLPDSSGISTLGLLMVGLNIIAIATIVVIWIMLR